MVALMGRPRKFDVDDALDEATLLFWSKGYADTSVSDLEERLEIGRQSIYSTFGDKHDLFLKALDRYLERQPAHRQLLWNEGAGLAEIRAFFAGIVAFVSEGSGRSCFLINTALTVEDDVAVTERCGRNQDHLTRSLANALRGALGQGEIDPATDIDGTALFLVGQVCGLNVMARNGSSPDILRRSADAALSTLR
jgi:TetR/AcrR family transcriptional regulator, transcriptional repressor for nem operon